MNASARNFEAKPAVRESVPLLVGLMGPSGSGKTFSALRLATGIQAVTGGDVYVIDTEARRALHYARRYKYDHVDFKPEYTPERCTLAIQELQRDGYDVIVFDSASDEYEGEGGLQEMAAAEGAWIRAKARHKHNLIRHLRNYAGTVIFCLRAEEKVKVEKVNGKTVFTPQGWMPICEKRFMYDMTLSFTLSPETPGLPRFDLPRKIGADFVDLFKEGRAIDRVVGEKLRAWALDIDAPFVPSGGGQQSTGTATSKAEQVAKALIDAANNAADETELLNAHAGETETKQLAWLKDKRPELFKEVNEAVAAKLKALQDA